MLYTYTHLFVIGKLSIISNAFEIVSIKFSNDPLGGESNAIIKKAIIQIEQYLRGERTQFSLPLRPNGTNFQQKVWNELLKVPYGQTCSYQEIANCIQNPLGVRAVGNALNKNPILIVIACHRVIGKNKLLSGYVAGVDHKKWLIELEKTNSLFSGKSEKS